MKVYVVWEYAVIEHEERFRNMGVFSSEEKAKAAIREYEEIAEAYKEHFEYNYEEFELDTVWETIKEEDTTEPFDSEPINTTTETIWESIQQMTKEELAEWLYANCEWISAEYGACSGANDSSDVLRLLDSVED